MTDNKLTDSITTSTTQLDLEGKTVKQETDEISSPDIVPLPITSKSEIIDNITEPNEKNGQKRIQPAPIDGANKKPRINTPEESSVETEQLEQEMVLSTEPVEQEMVLNTEPIEEVMVLKTELVDQEIILKNEQEEQEMDLKTDEGQQHMDQSSDTEEYYLTVHNLPTDWNYVQIKDFLDKECGHVDEMEMLKHRKSKSCAIRLTFQNFDKCTEMFNKLENKHVQDKKLHVKISDTYTTFPTGVTIPSTVRESLTKQCSISNEVIAATRRRRVSFNQLEALWKILNENRALATGYNKTCQAREYSKRMWQFAAATLNSLSDGAEKDWKSWCKYWNDFKSKLKHKVARARASMTEDGLSNQESLLDLELKFTQILGEDFQLGLPGQRVEPFDIPTGDRIEAESDPLLFAQESEDYIVVPPEQTAAVPTPPTPEQAISPPPSTLRHTRRQRQRRRRLIPMSADAARRALINMSKERVRIDERRNEILQNLCLELREIKNILNSRLPAVPDEKD